MSMQNSHLEKSKNIYIYVQNIFSYQILLIVHVEKKQHNHKMLLH